MTGVRSRAPWVVVVAVVIGVLAYAQTASGQSALTSMGLQSGPDRYTAFAFADVKALPYSAVSRDPLTMAVTIDNRRGDATEYTVTASGANSTTAVGHEAVVVPEGSSRTVTVAMTFRCAVPTDLSEADTLPTARVVLKLEPTGYTLTHTMYCRPKQ